MAKKRTTRGTGVEYPAVTQEDILNQLSDWKTAEAVGWELWPHLRGKGSSKGGPSNCAIVAGFQLRKLEHAGKVISKRGKWGPASFLVNPNWREEDAVDNNPPKRRRVRNE